MQGKDFVGPCAHGSDPYDRCFICEELSPEAAEALVKLWPTLPASERVKLRPRSFNGMDPETQWEIDKALGVLDWDGSDAET